ncbi:lysM and putative peptidoglycan-binding domain-containing protein 1 isoform X1 [Hypanus sabinus]|uniref:lysM and putative peptidoglycan-binding domain-containing protein 1 isoform X1 n=1 Tax=Hypanus sabinus TaxID=79690 RepID=UPI0028C3DDA7|nr:lysM and putative peptidoglycan-binding domain-containing protein 1 isoform X1 [Hypanus sabinus]
MATGGGAGGGSSAANECGALRASVAGRTRSYGSTARRPGSPVCGRHLEHRLQPGDTLQGLALRYGVTWEPYTEGWRKSAGQAAPTEGTESHGGLEEVRRASSTYRGNGEPRRAGGSPQGKQHLQRERRATLRAETLHQTEQIKRANRLYTSDSIFLKEVLIIPMAGKQENNGTWAESPQEGSPAGRPEDSPTPEMSASEFLRKIDAQITQSKAAALKKLRDDGDRFDGNSPSVLCRPLPTSQRALLGPARLTKTTRVTSLQDTEDEIFHL